MIELTTDNAIDYLRSRGWIAPGPARVELLSGGVSNAVLRVETPQRLMVLKQSCPQLRTRDAWFSDLDRVYREQEVMQLLHPLLPQVVPEVLHRSTRRTPACWQAERSDRVPSTCRRIMRCPLSGSRETSPAR